MDLCLARLVARMAGQQPTMYCISAYQVQLVSSLVNTVTNDIWAKNCNSSDGQGHDFAPVLASGIAFSRDPGLATRLT